ncbi:MAG: hypothetical protein Q9182_000028 [Xanthomendoza sp. 2 TL-2023]
MRPYTRIWDRAPYQKHNINEKMLHIKKTRTPPEQRLSEDELLEREKDAWVKPLSESDLIILDRVKKEKALGMWKESTRDCVLEGRDYEGGDCDGRDLTPEAMFTQQLMGPLPEKFTEESEGRDYEGTDYERRDLKGRDLTPEEMYIQDMMRPLRKQFTEDPEGRKFAGRCQNPPYLPLFPCWKGVPPFGVVGVTGHFPTWKKARTRQMQQLTKENQNNDIQNPFERILATGAPPPSIKKQNRDLFEYLLQSRDTRTIRLKAIRK